MKIEVVVKPGARKNEVLALDAGRWKVCVRARPVEGQANEAVREVVAQHFGVSKSKVVFLAGLKSKIKRMEIIV